MHHPPDSNRIEVAIYDSSYRAGGGSYWQWSSAPRDSSWDEAAGWIHRGWPVRGDLSSPTAVLYGAIRQPGELGVWFYRVYPAGRDQFNRPGRYFFALFRLGHVDEILNRHVCGVLDYFETMRELPLRTDPLNKGFPECPPDDTLVSVAAMLRKTQGGGHWGFDKSGGCIDFIFRVSESKPKIPSSVDKGSSNPPTPVKPENAAAHSRTTAESASTASVSRSLKTSSIGKLVPLAGAVAVMVWVGVWFLPRQFEANRAAGMAEGRRRGLDEGRRAGFEKGKKAGGECPKCGKQLTCPACDSRHGTGTPANPRGRINE